jgi:hypothetical protein
MHSTIAKGRTGVYHRAIGNSAARCNSRTGIVMGAVTIESVSRAMESTFCKKCFPNGKPSEEKLSKYF